MSGDHRETTKHNIDILLDIGFKKQGNTSIFIRDNNAILSPAVSSGKGGHYWFDLRKVNLDKVVVYNQQFFLIRIIPDMFIWLSLDDFSHMVTHTTKRERKNSGDVWGYYTSLNISSSSGNIVSTADSSLTHPVLIHTREEVEEKIKQTIIR